MNGISGKHRIVYVTIKTYFLKLQFLFFHLSIKMISDLEVSIYTKFYKILTLYFYDKHYRT